MNMQVSFLSPPFGPAAFYPKSVAPKNITLCEIFQCTGTVYRTTNSGSGVAYYLP